MSIFPEHPDTLGDDFMRVDGILKLAVENGDMLTEWENEFVYDLVERVEQYGKRTRISEKQMEVIDRISAKM
jgi:hypothetical protein